MAGGPKRCVQHRLRPYTQRLLWRHRMPAQPKRPSFFSQEHGSWIIPLTQRVIALVDRDIAETLGTLNWCATSHRGERWYAMRTPVRIDRKAGEPCFRMHRVIMAVDDQHEIDHRKHYPFEDRLIDNRRANLRICSGKENARNARLQRRLNKASRYKGVGWFKTDWRAQIRIDGNLLYLGTFAAEVEAALAYDEAARKFFGDFAATNESLGLLPTSLYLGDAP